MRQLPAAAPARRSVAAQDFRRALDCTVHRWAAGDEVASRYDAQRDGGGRVGGAGAGAAMTEMERLKELCGHVGVPS